jgi:DNA-binding beta-propeller fold protein YncE
MPLITSTPYRFPATAGTLDNPTFVQSFDPSDQDSTLTAVSFKSDGTKMFIMGFNTHAIYEYDLSVPWSVSSASIGSPEVKYVLPARDYRGLAFRGDGTKMYTIDSTNDDVDEYNLSPAWDATSASFVQSVDISGKETGPTGVVFKTDGLKMYITGTVSDSVHQYSISPAWDINPATFETTKDVSGQTNAPQDLAFNPDGLKMFVVGTSNTSVHEYDLSSAWQLSVVSFIQSFDVSGELSSPLGLAFKPDGTKMYVCGSTPTGVYEYNLA